MAGFFSMKVAPGVRISASGRGLRSHVGPRVARVHVGAGRTGISTGAGPFTLYESVGGSRRPSRQSAFDTGPSRAEVARAEKAQRAELIRTSLQRISDLPRQTFPAPVRPEVARAAVPSFPTLLREAEWEELKGIPLWRRRARADARRRARAHAESLALTKLDDARAFDQFAQAQVDDYYRRLAANDPGPVLGMLGTAFEDNEAPVAAVGVSGDQVSLVVLVPDADEVVPEQVAVTTAAGHPSLKKITKTERAFWEREVVAGHVVVSVKEAFATAPGLEGANVVAVRRTRESAGRGAVEPVLCAHLTRTAVHGAQWGTLPTWDLFVASATETRSKVKGVTKELKPLDVAGDPDLQQLLDAFGLRAAVA